MDRSTVQQVPADAPSYEGSRSTGAGTWLEQTTDTAVEIEDVDCPDSAHAWGVASNGILFKTSDSDTNWRRQRSTTGRALCDLDVGDGTRAFAVGDDGTIPSRKLTAPLCTVRLASTSGKPGTTLTICGWGVSSSRASSTVTIGSEGVTADRLWSNTRTKLKVPAMAAGKKKVTAKA